MENHLLEILCCPITRRSLQRVPVEKLQRINSAITAGNVRNQSQSSVETILDEALMTIDGELVYPIVDGIPVLLEDECIDWSACRDAPAGSA